MHERLPRIVIIIDELADLMMTVGRDIEEYITRLAQRLGPRVSILSLRLNVHRSMLSPGLSRPTFLLGYLSK